MIPHVLYKHVPGVDRIRFCDDQNETALLDSSISPINLKV